MTIRRLPADFLVTERLRDPFARAIGEPAAGRPHAVYRLTKESLTTPEAASKVAAALGVKGGAVAYGGLKDKHARTIQHVSVRIDPGAAPERIGEERGGVER